MEPDFHNWPAWQGRPSHNAERLFDFPPIGYLSTVDAAAALELPAAEQGIAFDSAALDSIIRDTHGYPYFLQEWGYRVWNGAANSPITPWDVSQVAGIVQNQLDANFFRVRLDRLTPREREYLRAMAQLGPGPHRSGAIARELGITVETAGPMRTVLIQKGMIYSPAHGDTAFTVPLFDEFMARAIPDWVSDRRRRSR